MPDENTTNKIPDGFQLRHTLVGHTETIGRITWSPDGRMLASMGSGGAIKFWDFQSGHLVRTLTGDLWTGISGAWSPNMQTFASSSATGVAIWDSNTGEPLRNVGDGNGMCVVWPRGNTELAFSTYNGSIKFYDIKDNRLKFEIQSNKNQINDLSFSPDGRIFASASRATIIDIWDAETGEQYLRLEGHNGGVYKTIWSLDGRYLMSASNDHTIGIWDISAGSKIRTIEGHTGLVKCLSLSHDGRILASKSDDNTVRLWRTDTWETVAVLEEVTNERWTPGIAFHPHLPVLATLGDADAVVRIWQLDFDLLLGGTTVQESVHYTTAKLALVGDSGVGKTGLGWRLAHGEFKEHPSTHGQQFWVINELGAIREDRTECEAVLWDLAGQPDYRLIHALFLDDVDLALVLFDPTNRQEPLKGVEYWLNQLSRKGRQGRMILVGARADRGTPTLTSEELSEFCQQRGIDGGYISTSARSGEGLEELLERVKAAIDWQSMTATVTTTTFKRIKEYVLALKEDSERKGILVSPAELRARLEGQDAELDFSDAEMMTAVGHLETHGYVAILRGSSGEVTILLVPDVLANLASSLVLEARRNPKGLGALEEGRVLRGEYRFAELEYLEKHERDLLLDSALVLFLEHNMCFRETLGEQAFLIFPALINQKRPLVEEIETVDDVSYRVSGAVENVYASLVVQLGYTNTFTRTNQWQHQAEYETARGDICGFRQVEEREGEIELVLYYAKDKQGARMLFQGLFEEFLRGRDVTVIKFPPVVCPKCRYRQQRSEVVKRLGEGKGFLFCGECGKKIILPKAGEPVALSSNERQQLSQEQTHTRLRTLFESALSRLKGFVRDEQLSTPNCFISYAWGDAAQERWVRGLTTDLQKADIEVILDQNDNAHIGANIARFISRIEQTEYIIVVGTPLYRKKYENKLSSTGSIVAAEVDLITLRLTGTEKEKDTVLPLLLAGATRNSLPPLLHGRVYGDFREESRYLIVLFDLILTLYRIPLGHPAVRDLRESLSRETVKASGF